jgi:hypothetical protein
MKVTMCKPAKARKPRKTELYTICVKWKDGDGLFFQWFKRDKEAMKFQQQLMNEGIDMWDIRVTMK